MPLYQTDCDWIAAHDLDDLHRILAAQGCECQVEDAEPLPDEDFQTFWQHRTEMERIGYPDGYSEIPQRSPLFEDTITIQATAGAWCRWGIAQGDSYDHRLVATTEY